MGRSSEEDGITGTADISWSISLQTGEPSVLCLHFQYGW